MKPILMVAVVWFLSGASWLHSQEALKVPKGTERVLSKASPAAAQKPYFPQAEEFCRKQLGDGSFVRHGPYILWGPNGERLVEGQYYEDRRDGKWLYWRPSQVLESTWKNGEQITTRVLPQPKEFTIDFGAAAPQRIHHSGYIRLHDIQDPWQARQVLSI